MTSGHDANQGRPDGAGDGTSGDEPLEGLLGDHPSVGRGRAANERQTIADPDHVSIGPSSTDPAASSDDLEARLRAIPDAPPTPVSAMGAAHGTPGPDDTQRLDQDHTQVLTPPTPPPPPRRGRRRRPSKPPKPTRPGSKLVLWLVPVALVGLGVATFFLLRTGLDLSLESSEGAAVETITDPTAPSYRAQVDPTPSLMVIAVDRERDLAGVAVLALAENDTGGSVLVIPPETVAGEQTLAAIVETDGLAAVESAVAGILDAGVVETVVVGPAEWETLLGPVAPLELDVLDPLVAADGSVSFPAGPVALAADETVDYYDWANAGESGINRLDRQARFWEAWIAAVAADDGDGAVPGDPDAGLARFVDGLAAGEVVFVELPLFPEGDPQAGTEVFNTDPFGTAPIVQDMLPFPIAAEPGDRPRVRVLNGTTETGLTLVVAREAVLVRSEIRVLGNADVLDVETTQVLYHDADFLEEAERIASALGVSTVVFDEREDFSIDITVLIGSDLVGFGGSDG